ncbi:HIT domain-containing protein, partial [Myxococcota bacterium]|nr:HIT domain-containing protein [Myxococcota bacterium]
SQYRARVEALKDPFMPLARGDKRAREKERILFENDAAMVVVDLYSKAPKALVVPKNEMLFPCDGTDFDLQMLSDLAEKTALAFKQSIENNPESRVWINPPAALMVRQLHIHIQPSTGIVGPNEKERIFKSVIRILSETV